MNRRQRRTQWQASQRLSAEPSPAAAPGYSAIDMRVGELVLRGFDRHFASRVAVAFEQSLSERLRSAALPAPLRQSMRSPQMCLAPVKLRRSRDAAAIGEELARSVLALDTGRGRRGGPR